MVLIMTRQTVTTVVSAVVFVVLAALIAVIPVPFVAWAPGSTYNVLEVKDQSSAIEIQGVATYPTDGQLLMTTVSVTRVDSQLGLAEAVLGYLTPNHDVLPREAIYPAGRSATEVKAAEVAMMDTSQQDAVVAGLRAANIPVTEMPMVASVVLTGPANGKLAPGDLIEKVDASAVQSQEDVRRDIRKHQVGDLVTLDVLRDGKPLKVTVTSVSSSEDGRVPAVGINLATGYRYLPTVKYNVASDIVGPSAGLMFALAIYDQLTPGALTAGEVVAGTGEISPTGEVARIGGIQEKIAGAERAGARIFLVPEGNCRDLAGVDTHMQLVKVKSLDAAITALHALTESPDAEVPRC